MKHLSECALKQTGRYTLGCAACLKMAQTFSRNDAAAELARKGGRSKSDAKCAAARDNGKLGGRPRKIKVSA